MNNTQSYNLFKFYNLKYDVNPEDYRFTPNKFTWCHFKCHICIIRGECDNLSTTKTPFLNDAELEIAKSKHPELFI